MRYTHRRSSGQVRADAVAGLVDYVRANRGAGHSRLSLLRQLTDSPAGASLASEEACAACVEQVIRMFELDVIGA